MISLKKYLDAVPDGVETGKEGGGDGFTAMALAAYASALVGMGVCSVDACPGLGSALREALHEISRGVSTAATRESLSTADREVRQQLENWGRNTARHYQQKSDEVKELLLVMARTAESVGSRDRRCAGQMHEVTTRLTTIASLDDLTQIRASIKKSAAELKTSIDRMTEEGKAAIVQLQRQVTTYREKLEAAEEVASRDGLTGLRNRLCIERLIEGQIAGAATFCVAMVDIDGFKKVNDEHGHLTGDELLKQFSNELRSACRATDAIGRWGGDEFILLFPCGMGEAGAQVDRLGKWACGDYSVQGRSGPQKIRVNASMGVAEYVPGEAMKDLLARADAAMYRNKADGIKQQRES